MSQESNIRIDQAGPGKFVLTVLFEGRTFECGSYLTRVAALQAGRLFVERKEDEREGRKKRPKGKPIGKETA